LCLSGSIAYYGHKVYKSEGKWTKVHSESESLNDKGRSLLYFVFTICSSESSLYLFWLDWGLLKLKVLGPTFNDLHFLAVILLNYLFSNYIIHRIWNSFGFVNGQILVCTRLLSQDLVPTRCLFWLDWGLLRSHWTSSCYWRKQWQIWINFTRSNRTNTVICICIYSEWTLVHFPSVIIRLNYTFNAWTVWTHI
jgi:hypothetical protein